MACKATAESAKQVVEAESACAAQAVGHADANVLTAALEWKLASEPRTARPVPCLEKLAATPAMHTREPHLGFSLSPSDAWD